jgi:nucleoside-diphosphate-sugar epimerase
VGLGQSRLEDLVAAVRILVTGNMGYVGPVVVEHLRAARPDAELYGLDTGFFAQCLTGTDLLPERRLDCQWFGDVRHPPAGALDGVDGVAHLAGISNDPIGNTYETPTLEINHRATVELARAAKAAGARSFVFASSCSIYGLAEDGLRTEDSETAPLTAYAKSKLLAERDLAELADERFAVTSLRFATACGMSDRLRLDLVLNDFVAGAHAFREITILSDGTPWRPLIHVRDMARAIDWALDRTADNGGAYLAVNAGSDEWNYQIRQLADAVAAIVPDVNVSVREDAAPDSRSYKVSFARFRELAPDHQPQVGLPEAIEDLSAGLGRMGFHDPDFRNSELVRLRVLENLRGEGLVNEALEWSRADEPVARV